MGGCHNRLAGSKLGENGDHSCAIRDALWPRLACSDDREEATDKMAELGSCLPDTFICAAEAA